METATTIPQQNRRSTDWRAKDLEIRAMIEADGRGPRADPRLGLALDSMPDDFARAYRAAYGEERTHCPLPIVVCGVFNDVDKWRTDLRLMSSYYYVINREPHRLNSLSGDLMVVRLPSLQHSPHKADIEHLIAVRFPHMSNGPAPTLAGTIVSTDVAAGFDVGVIFQQLISGSKVIEREVTAAALPHLIRLTEQAEGRLTQLSSPIPGRVMVRLTV